MARAVVILAGQAERQKAAKWALTAPLNTRVEFKESRRSIPQNALMWCRLTEIAQQVEWHGMKLSADDWKLIFLAALKQEMRIVPNLDGTGFVNLGRSSSDLSKAEMTDLQTIIEMFAAQHGVTLSDQREAA